MKNNNRNNFDDYTVDVIPEGKENEYFSKEQSAEIIRKLKNVVRFFIILLTFLIMFLISSILKLFIDFPSWINILINSILILGSIISIIIGAIKYMYLKKCVDDNSNI